MNAAPPLSRFASLSRGQALLVLALTLAVVTWCLKVALTEDTLPLPRAARQAAGTAKRTTETDWVFYRRIVERVHAGENYYDAVQDEFAQPQWDFQPTSVFNWRTPLYAWLLGSFPVPEWGKGLLTLLALAVMLMAFAVVERELGKPCAPLALLLIGPFAWCINADVFLFTELWAGTLLTLAVLADALERWPLAVAASLAALLLRELVLPYCLLALALALVRQRRAEVFAWIVGLALFGLFYAYHLQEVSRRIITTDVVQASQWVRFGGTAFVLGTTELSNLFLINAPSWVTALFLPLALLGLAGWPGWTGVRAGLTCAGYLAAFAVIGQPANAYWGLLIAPLLALGLAALPTVARDLARPLVRASPS